MVDTILKYAYYLFVASIVGLGVLLLLSAIPTANLTVKIVESGSMEPSIKTGSIVVIREYAQYQKGDVITFFFDEGDATPTTHRIVEIDTEDGEDRYITKGDANENEDPRAIEEEMVLGKVLLSIPFIGYILDFAREPLGFALIIGLPALFIIIDESMKIYHEVRRTLKEEQEHKDTTT